jgi:CBS-domain-containing membrane protein
MHRGMCACPHCYQAQVCNIVLVSEQVKKLQWLYIFMPAFVGCIIMIAVSILVNNMSARRKYPQFW